MLTDHEWQEAQDGLCLLLCWVITLRCHQLLAGVLAGNEQHRQHQVGDSIMPANWGLAVNKGEQPGQTAALHTCTDATAQGTGRQKLENGLMCSVISYGVPGLLLPAQQSIHTESTVKRQDR